jgi:hypothetical protein
VAKDQKPEEVADLVIMTTLSLLTFAKEAEEYSKINTQEEGDLGPIFLKA